MDIGPHYTHLAADWKNAGWFVFDSRLHPSSVWLDSKNSGHTLGTWRNFTRSLQKVSTGCALAGAVCSAQCAADSAGASGLGEVLSAKQKTGPKSNFRLGSVCGVANHGCAQCLRPSRQNHTAKIRLAKNAR
jgi:hypothetical protein